MSPPRLTSQRISEAALELIDAHGLGALSMRRLGKALGVEAMSLYGHVSNKAALLDLVHERVLAQMVRPPDSGDWLVDIRGFALSFRAALRRHPRALPIFATRPAVAPGSLQQVDAALAALIGAGFTPAKALAALHVLFTYVVGHTLYQDGPKEHHSEINYASLERAAYPHLLAAAETLPQRDPDEEFNFGLDALLTGVRVVHRPNG